MAVPFSQVQASGNAILSNVSTTMNITWSNAVGQGHMIVVCAGTSNNSIATITGVSDSAGNTYTLVDSGSDIAFGNFWYAYAVQTIAGLTVKVTQSAIGTSMTATAAEYAGPGYSKPIDVHSTTTGLGTSIGTGTTPATGYPSELVIVWGVAATSTPSFTVGAGYADLVTNAGTSVSTAIEDKTVTTTGTQTGTINCGSTSWIGGIATFNAGGSNKPSVILRPHIFSPGLAR